MDFDAALRLVGAMGRYQIFVVLLMAFCSWSFLANMMISIFAGLKKPTSCSTNNASLCFQVENHSSSYFESAVTEWGVGEYEFTVINTLQMMGIFLGTFLVGHVSDKYGRKTTWMLGICVMGFFGAVTAASPRWEVMAAIRFIVGIGAAGNSTAVTTMLTEITSKSHRLWMVEMYMLWELGFPWIALMAYLTQNWRYLTLIVNLQLIPGLLCFIFVYESPRWLIQKDRVPNSIEVLKRIASRNRRDEKTLGPLSQLKPIITTQQLGWKVLFTDKVFRKHMLALSFCAFATYQVMYGLMLNAGQLIGNVYLNVSVFGLLKLVPAAIVILAEQKLHVGRKILMITGYLGMGIFMLVVLVEIVVDVNHRFSWLIDAGAIVGAAFSNQCAVMGYLFPSEIFPTLIRNRAAAMSSASARFATVLAPLVLLSGKLWMGLPYLIFTILSVAAAFSCGLFLPETHGKPLPESAASQV